MLVDAVVIWAVAGGHSQQLQEILEKVRAWDRRVTAPAMIIAWLTGLSLSMMGRWFPQGWLLVKLGLVLILSGLHGMMSGRLRRAAGDAPMSASTAQQWLGPIILAFAASIITLVMVKPL
ncbi:CopD family protein [Rhizobium mesoamericanum]|uniref:CopD family protein n=1 Tax=Rhizobium mesoamericanum TaxID=1079800 RepID=UPI00399D6E15